MLVGHASGVAQAWLQLINLLPGLARLEQTLEPLDGGPAVVRYLGSTIVLGDEACYCQFEGPSQAAVAELNRKAGLPFGADRPGGAHSTQSVSAAVRCLWPHPSPAPPAVDDLTGQSCARPETHRRAAQAIQDAISGGRSGRNASQPPGTSRSEILGSARP